MLDIRASVASHLSTRLASAEASHWVEWMHAVAELPGDPYGITVSDNPSGSLIHVHGVPLSYYNRIINPIGGDDLRSHLAFFRQRMSPCRVDLSPFDADPALLRVLIGEGLAPAQFQTSLYASPIPVPEPHKRDTVVRDVQVKEATFFARLFERAYFGARAPRRLARFRTDSIKARFERPGWRFYMATVDGVPAAGGVMFIDGLTATLAGGATMARFRGRGCQSALLRRRLADAREAGCDLIVARCAVGSRSQVNIERAGLRTGYTKSIWESIFAG